MTKKQAKEAYRLANGFSEAATKIRDLLADLDSLRSAAPRSQWVALAKAAALAVSAESLKVRLTLAEIDHLLIFASREAQRESSLETQKAEGPDAQ